MSSSNEIPAWIEESDSLVECLERAADSDTDLSQEQMATHVMNYVWEREIPVTRAIAILEREQARLDAYQHISVSENSREPRYTDLADLDLLSGYEFEHVLAEVLAQLEGDAEVTTASGDQGLDIVWFRDDYTVGIQAKRYDKDNPVGNSAVQEIYTGAQVKQSEYDIDEAAVVTTSRYTTSAKEAADESDVSLYGRKHLQEWLDEVSLTAESIGEVLEEE